MSTTLLAEIEAFLATHGMKATRFGREAMGDSHFVLDLRAGDRRIWPETEAKVRSYMVTFKPEAA